jgi:hypothetical protein
MGCQVGRENVVLGASGTSTAVPFPASAACAVTLMAKTTITKNARTMISLGAWFPARRITRLMHLTDSLKSMRD